jgi:hypothetical protein
MTETLLQFLESQKVDSETLQQATRYYLAERTGDLSESEMQSQLVQAGGDKKTIDAALGQLKGNSLMIDNACLAFLSDAWENETERSKIKDAAAEAKTKLPVIEIGILAMVAMYGMYLAVTGGIIRHTVERKPDGTFKESTEYHPPTGPLGALVKMVVPIGKAAGKAAK